MMVIPKQYQGLCRFLFWNPVRNLVRDPKVWATELLRLDFDEMAEDEGEGDEDEDEDSIS